MNRRPRYNAIFVKRFREEFIRCGLNGREFSRRTNVARSILYSYLNGYSQPRIDSFTDICKVLNVSVDYLLGISDIKEVSK